MIMNIETTPQQDIYSWRVYYGSGLLDEANAQAPFADVSVGCTSLALIDQAGKAAHVVEIPGGAKPVFFRRRTVSINLVDESSTPQGTIHCIGWKRSDEDAVYLFVYEDGSCLLSSDLQAA